MALRVGVLPNSSHPQQRKLCVRPTTPAAPLPALRPAAPGTRGGHAGQYKCGHNLLLAHARVYRLYREKYHAKQKGKISMALDGKWGYPWSDKPEGGRGGQGG